MASLMRLTRDAGGIVDVGGDDVGDDLASMPPAIRELRAATVNLSLSMFNRKGENQLVKVLGRRDSEAESRRSIGRVIQVAGYVTMLKFVNGRTPRQIEAMLGFKTGMLAGGADVFLIEDTLAPDQFAPRYTSAWAAGVSPRDLHTLGASYHPNYPPASQPVYQWVIHRSKRANARKIATLNYDQVFRYP